MKKITDKQRLDWLIANEATILNYKDLHWVHIFRREFTTQTEEIYFKTPREAIDAAIRGGKP